jgi:Cu(I)/Ag(I) efflux system membrane protein CusA/SilA
VLLKDVAQVQFAPAPKRGESFINTKPGVILMVKKQPEADTLAVTAGIDQALNEMKRAFPSGVEINGALFKQADFINAAVGNVKQALRDGSLMVALVLLVFLLNIRTTAITLITIPLSLLITAIVFRWAGIGVNTMTLGGLAIAMGELVDDAIVDVENVFRRLRENRQIENPRPALQVIYEASSEIRNSIVLATVIVVLVFVPVFALSGIEGRLFTPIGIGYIVSLVASLLISLTVTPVLCYYLLGKTSPGKNTDGWLVRRLKDCDRRLLGRTLDHPLKIAAGAAVLVVLAIATVPLMGRNFLPSFNEGSVMIEIEAKPGLSLAASSALANRISEAILTVPEVISVGRRTGRAEEDDHAAGVNHSEFEVALRSSNRPRAVVDLELRDKVVALLPPEAYMMLSQPITHRLDHVLSGLKSQVAIKAFGPDLRVLRQLASDIKFEIQGVPGIVDLRLESQVLFPQIKIYAMRPDLARFGIVPGDLVEALEVMLQGVPVTRIIEKERTLEVFLRLDERSRQDIDAIRTIPVHVLPTGEVIPLSAVADIFETSGPNTIERESMQRRFAVSFNITGRDLNSAVEDAKRRIEANIKLPASYSIEFGGRYESQRRAIRLVSILGLLSLMAVFVVLLLHFRSVGLALQIMINIPLALIGSVFAVYVTERTFSVATLIAFITLCGIASRNGIMMISHYIHLMKYEGEQFSRKMVIRGSLERLIPVLMTAFSAILALTPLLFAKDQPGKEILHPVAVVIVGGLLSSTLLDIFLTPALFYRFGKKSAERLARIPGQNDSNNIQGEIK